MSNKYIGTKDGLIGPETDHPEEGAAYLQPAPAAVTDEGEFGDKLSDAEHFFYKHCVIFQGINAGEYLDKEDFLKYVKAIESPTYPAEFVEWMAQHSLRIGEDKYLLYNKAGSFTKEKIFTEWKRIIEQSK